MSDKRYEYQGELQIELTEKIKIALDHVTDKNKGMIADSLFELISLGIYNQNLSVEERWGLINSMAGQYLNNHVDPDAVFPSHVMKELELIRNYAIKRH